VRSHVAHLALYSTLVALFFAVLLHRERRRQARFFVLTWIAMVGGVLSLAYLMFPFPR
jgi:cytochrome bd-type quinol oxidase subunit 2